MWFYIFITLVLCGVICAYAAQGRGFSTLGWLFGGFLLGPAGIVLVLVIPKNTFELEQRALLTRTVKRCEACAELVRVEAVKCRYCAADLPAVQSAPSAPRVPPAEWPGPPH